MNKDYKLFLSKLCRTSSDLERAYNSTIEYWEGERPPITSLFSALGREISMRYGEMSEHQREVVFTLVEDAMSDDGDLGEAVATGLIEAVIGHAATTNDLWSKIRPRLGILSRKHADAWISL